MNILEFGLLSDTEKDIFSSFFLEAEDNKSIFRERSLKMNLLDVEDFVKKNEVKEITNPIFFVRDGIPSPDGLLSYEIFGITKEERANLWGYIELHGPFFHPLCYKLWCRMDSNIRAIVHGTETFKINSSGYLEKDPDGETGLEWLYKNIDNIKIKSTDSRSREKKITFLKANKKYMFIKKLIVQPPYYRDVLSTKGKTDVGMINKYYASVLISANSLKETQDYGFSLGDATKGRLQESILNVYGCITGTSNNPDDGKGLAKKFGLMNEAALAKTTDYGARLVITAPELKVESLDDLMVDVTHCALPLATALTLFKPFILFNVRRYFENEFQSTAKISCIYKGKIVYGKVKDPLITFSDEVIEHHIKKFVYGFSNRFEPLEIPIELEDGTVVSGFGVFRGYHGISTEQYQKGEYDNDSLLQRKLTWCDILYMAAVESVKDRCVLITRYPIDSAYSQFPSLVRIATVNHTESIVINNTYYRWYPRITPEEVGSNTSNKFIDSLNICNLLLAGIGGDYDGDTVGIKGCYLNETNKELINYIHSNAMYINASGKSYREASHEAMQSIYSMTKILTADKDKMTANIQF